MSRKNLNVEAIQNELQGGASLFFQRATPPLSSFPKGEIEAKSERTNERSIVEMNKRTEAAIQQKQPRRIIRHTFDIYHDQLISLQDLQITAMRKNRKKPKLGKMVQKGLDLYIAREKKKNSPL